MAAKGLGTCHWDREKYDVGERWATFLPDGQHFVYAALRGDKRHDIYSGSLDGKPGKLLVHNAAAPTFAQGKLFFERDGYLYAQPFDPDRLKLSGETSQVVRTQLAFLGVGGIANYAVAGNVLAYHAQLYPKMELSWEDFHGKRLGALAEPSFWQNPRTSPDGTKVLASNSDPLTHTRDLWILDTARKACAGLSTEEFIRPLGNSFPSLRDTLVHVLGAEWLWLERWNGRFPRAMLTSSEFPNVASIEQRWRVVERTSGSICQGSRKILSPDQSPTPT